MRPEESAVVMIDGEIVSPEQARVSVFDRGFLYGDSVFEVMRVYSGRAFALEEHVDRLFRSAALVFIDLPIHAPQMCREIDTAVRGSSFPDGVVRVHVTRGIAQLGLDPTAARDPLRVLIYAPPHPPTVDDYRQGIAVASYRTERAVDNTEAAGAKVANYLVSLLALRNARSLGAKEAIIVDGRGRVLEGASSNVFIVKDGVLLTPPDNEGILPGITRSYLLRAAESLQVPIRITTLTRGDVLGADEMFLTSTVREVLPVVRVDDKIVSEGTVGPLTRALHRRFRELAGVTGPQPWELTPP